MGKSFLSGQNTKKKKQPGPGHPSWQKFGLAIIVLIIAFGLGVGTFYLRNDTTRQEDRQQFEDNTKLPPAKQPPKGAREEAQALAFKGKYDQAQQRLAQAIKASDSDQRKQKLLIQQATVALNAEKYEASLRYAKQAIALVNDYSSYQVAARAAHLAGKYPLAEQYYRTALNKYPKDSPNYESVTKHLRQLIQEVSQKAAR